MTDRVTSFFSVNTQFENIGDALINRELVRLAARQAPVKVDLSRCPPAFRKTLALETVENVELVDGSKSLFREILRYRLSGGTPVFLLKPGAYLGPLGLSVPKAFIILCLQLGMRLMGIKICHIGVSYERLSGPHRFFLRVRSRLLFAHYVRDEASFDYARTHGFTPDGILPDLALNIYDSHARQSEQIRRIGVSFRTDQYSEQLDHVLTFLQWLIETVGRKNIDGFVMVAQVERDIAPMTVASRMIDTQFGIDTKVVECHENLASCEAAYDECDFIVSNRLHSLLIGGNQCPRILACITPFYNRKIIGLFDALDLDRHVIEIDAMDEVETAKALQYSMAHGFDGRKAAQKLDEGVQEIFSKMD